jgi:hypothetical protein
MARRGDCYKTKVLARDTFAPRFAISDASGRETAGDNED